ncbi:DNA-3-methyladenine glycosylase I [Miniphocaeibacter halophilus]|uniref:DNA-3-methyladenine glycosylase I n=1 Tax=Miniphocaeibacter halophilus TaxID=2931922 RepID=A0AC61MZX2_9FIRM|nr:DNA-3-methyladenine glycosylase I [Miniphocaeibacter halophilus]QQK08478.1 DNA-3-methyladenine glycosylase I [Miniphocaeibacter halophilus]
MSKENRICDWAENSKIEREYHDNEWGIPNHDDRYLFEMLILEGAQAGLSWSIILKKRNEYKKAFDNFEPSKVAKYDIKKKEELLKNKGIIRNRRKIESAINNAIRFLEVQEEFGTFDKYIWSFTNGKQVINQWTDTTSIPSSSDLSKSISKDLKKRGFTFVGEVIIYSYLQAIGIIDDHLIYCRKNR